MATKRERRGTTLRKHVADEYVSLGELETRLRASIRPAGVTDVLSDIMGAGHTTVNLAGTRTRITRHARNLYGLRAC